MEAQEAVKEVSPAEEPTISPENITEEQLRAMAAEADGIPYKATPKANIEPEVAAQDSQGASETTQPEASEEEKDSDESASKADEKTDSKPEERKASETSEAPKVEDKREAKLAKDEARLAESWKKLESEKAQVRQLHAELERVKSEAEKASDPTNISPEALRKYAKEWENEGRDDLAKAAREQASQMEEKSRRNAEKNERSLRDFNDKWGSNVNRMIAENPELRDDTSDLGKRVISILKSEDAELRTLINSTPNGFVYATQIAKMQAAAEASEALRSEVENLRKENSELRKKTSLSAGSTAKASTKRKAFDEMNYQEQEEFLRRSASDSDKLGVLIGD